FMVRQSSAPITCVGSLASSCKQAAPKLVVASGADQQAGGCGACQRSAPTGGAAYGIANQAQVPFACGPCTGPRSVGTNPGAALTDDGQAPPSPPPPPSGMPFPAGDELQAATKMTRRAAGRMEPLGRATAVPPSAARKSAQFAACA